VFELLAVDEALRERLVQGATGAELRAAARSSGMRSLMDEGRRLSGLGVTTMLEVERVISGTEE
jgi:type II secretory ATPase GspE/PulE/Tfp pilus assembly ATPase PilB-like protein